MNCKVEWYDADGACIHETQIIPTVGATLTDTATGTTYRVTAINYEFDSLAKPDGFTSVIVSSETIKDTAEYLC